MVTSAWVKRLTDPMDTMDGMDRMDTRWLGVPVLRFSV